MESKNAFRRFPSIKINGHDKDAVIDCNAICSQISLLCQRNTKTIIVIECYPGVNQTELKSLFSPLKINSFIHSDDLALPPAEIDAQIKHDLTEDPVFGIMTTRRLEEFFPTKKLEATISFFKKKYFFFFKKKILFFKKKKKNIFFFFFKK